MRTVDDFARIRQLHRDGISARQIANQLGVGRDTIRKALADPEPKPYTLAQPRAAPVFGPFRAIVDAIVAADATAPPKQRHTASQIYRRLVAEHGYRGRYDQVRRHLRDRRRERRATFLPLDHAPGHRCEADFGHIRVDFPDGRRLVPVLIVTWSYSNAPFAVALPTERAEAVLHGLCEAFAFFGAVPKEVWWDNPATVAIHIRRGRDRTLHPRYAALASHFLFAPTFCLPATPQEKPRVENRVKDLERMGATPVPRVADLAGLNDHLRRCCLAARDRTCGTNAETVGVRSERDRAAALPVATRPFEACVIGPGSVDKYQTVGFDGNRYSVPRRYAFRGVTVKGFMTGPKSSPTTRPSPPTPAATRGTSGSSTRSTSWSSWGRSRRPWITPRSTATGSCPRRSPRCDNDSQRTVVSGPGRGTTSGCCNCWPGSRWRRSNRPSPWPWPAATSNSVSRSR
jgi:transposase